MKHLRARLALVLACAPALVATACTAFPAPRPSAPAAAPETPALPAADAGLDAQASWLKGSTAKLTAIDGARAWLRSPDFEAWRDESGAECVYDRARNRVLSWEPGAHTVSGFDDAHKPDGYGVTAGEAAKKAQERARQEYAGDLAGMRCTAVFTTGDRGPDIDFTFQRYVNGIRTPDLVTVNCSGTTGEARFVAHYTKPARAANGYTVRTPLPLAVTNAAKAARLTGWRFLAATLDVPAPVGRSQETTVVWTIVLEGGAETTASTPVAGEQTTVLVDPATGAASPAAGG